MKIDTRYGSIWDELPRKTERKVPTTQQEAVDFYEAAESSIHKAVIKTMDGHNERVKESAEFRKVKHRKEDIEREAQQRRDEHTRFLKESEARREALKL